jgi:hypothetical protein
MASTSYQTSWKSTSGLKDNHGSFIPKASNAFTSYLPYSKQALVAMLTSLPLCCVCPIANYMPWLPHFFFPWSVVGLLSTQAWMPAYASTLHSWLPYLHQLKTVRDVTLVTQQCKQSQTTAVQGWKSCTQLTTLNLNHFKMLGAMGLTINASRSL